VLDPLSQRLSLAVLLIMNVNIPQIMEREFMAA
jgi:hypothetical protein